MKKTKIIAFIGFLGMVFLYLNFFSSYVMPWQKEEAIQSVLTWGGLAALPENAKIIEIGKYGSMFTRQFKIEFTSSKAEIEKWILKSKRLKSNTPKFQKETKIYQIHPGEFDSYGGEVTIKGNTVFINISWS